jgi:hypothetical protein
MAVIVNKNTTQAPMSTTGLTGAQVLKFITAPRVYVKALDATPTPVLVKSNGSTPSGWTDLGGIDGTLKITYTKDMKEVRTGIDEVLRAVYIGKKTAGFEFNLNQFDDVALAQLSGVTASTIQSGSAVSFGIGAEDVVQKALLMVIQNKLDGKEMQFYHPDAYMSFSVEDSGGSTVIKGSANLPMFAWTGSGGTEAVMIQSVFA